jgi:uncharacterized protein (DUF608 family)
LPEPTDLWRRTGDGYALATREVKALNQEVMTDSAFGRRDFLRWSIHAGGVAGLTQAAGALEDRPAQSRLAPMLPAPSATGAFHEFNGTYEGVTLSQIAFPMGGMGAGMICLEGSGGLSKFLLRHDRPEFERQVFGAIAIKGSQAAARILEGPVPNWKLRPQFNGLDGTTCWGLPRLHEATFQAVFPFATVRLTDKQLPLEASVTGWSPFSPGDADNASLPVAGLEYRLENRSQSTMEAVFSFNAENFLAQPSDSHPDHLDRILPTSGGFILHGAGPKERPWDEGYCAAWVDDPKAEVSCTWPLDSLAVLWKEFASGNFRARHPLQDKSAAGASIFVPFTLAPGEAKVIVVRLAWYVANSNLYEPEQGFHNAELISYPRPAESYRPWYAERFAGIDAVIQYWQDNYSTLRQAAQVFSKTFHDSSLPPEVIEAVSTNLSILKSPTVLRQTDGRLWGWEGTFLESPDVDRTGVSGTSTHVWNYAQTIAHLFPELERGLRETEFGSNQNEEGLQYCRTPLPIRSVEPGHIFPDGPAADGQLGGLIKLYREWRISGDTEWLRRLWPKARASLDYCIRTWDPQHKGWLEEPHLTTYDMEFWGADSLCASLYLGALKAVVSMSEALQESADLYVELLDKGRKRMEAQLFNGQYFVQSAQWRELRASFPPKQSLWPELRIESPDQATVAQSEGPAGQYGTGCLSDGVMGEWLCLMSGVGAVLDRRKVESHLTAVHRHNFKKDLTDHANFMRASFACGNEAGLLVCSWPRGGRPSVPLIYCDEVWTGIEYQVASHLITMGNIDSGLDIVRATRRRYDGRVRNPFAEVEAGHWYARAMSSYALLQAFSGARFDAVDRVLYLRPAIHGDFRCFLSTATGFGVVGVKNGKPFLEVASGQIPYREIEYTAA